MKNWQFAFRGNWPTTVVLALGIVAVALAYVFYLKKRAQLPPRTFAVLSALRTLSIVAAALFLLKPVIRYSHTETEEKEAIVLVDVSQSMGIRDATEGRSRLEAGLRLLRADPWHLLDELSRNQRVRLFSFGVFTSELDHEARIVPDQKATAIGEALVQAISRVGASAVSGVVLLSDGVSNTGQEPHEVAGFLGVPVFTVVLGGRIAEKGRFHDVGITGAPRSPEFIVNNRATINLKVSGHGLQGFTQEERLLTLTVKRDEQVLATQSVQFPRADGVREVQITYVPRERGIHRLTASLLLLPGETVEENNTRAFTVEVTDPKIRILLVEGVVRSEYRFLRRALGSDPNVDLTSTVKLRKDRFLHQGTAAGVDLSRGLPASPEDYKKFDVVMLGDIGREEFIDLQLEYLREFVSDGGALLTMGGYHAYGVGGYAGSPLAQVLPVRLGGMQDGQAEGRFAPVLTQAGRSHPVLAGSAEFFGPGSERAILDGANKVLGAKPGAAVLLEHPSEKSAEGAMPVLAAQRYGGGRVLAIMADTTWKWKFQVEARGLDSPYYRFWRQAVRWLASRRQEELEGEELLSAWPGKTLYDRGQTVQIEARVRDRARQPTDAASVEVEIRYPVPVERSDEKGGKLTETGASLPLDPIPVGGGRYQGSFRPPASGIYRAVVRASDEDGLLGEAEFEFVIGEVRGEFDRVDVDEATLRAIASQTGGRFHTLATAKRIPEELERKRRIMVKTEERNLWNEPAFFLVFLVCVAAEWVLRKRHGLN